MEELKSIIKKLSAKQREVFDAICINDDSCHHPKTLASLERKGLIRGCRETSGNVTIFRYDLADTSVHMAWCEVCSAEHPEDLEGHSSDEQPN